jgi:hypothetical protein
MYNGPYLNNTGLIFALDASSLRSVSGTGNQAYNGAPNLARDIINKSITITSNNGTRLTNVNYYTSFGISYPEGNYGGAAANRQGLTAGFNVTSGGKTYDASRALHLWVWDNRTNSWVPDSFFNGLRLGGHCYDNWAGAESGWQNELNKFNADFINIRNSFPDSTWIVNGSHASQMFDSTTINNLISLGAPSGTISSWTDGSAWREFVLVGEPGLGSGNYYGWAYENYSVDPSVVAQLIFPLPLKGNKSSGFLFDGADDYMDIPTSVFPAMNQMAIELINFGIDARNSSIIAGGIGGNQDLNIHLPWGDGNIYWDLGRPFNRVYKAAGSDYIGYHHWVFTKNPSTGIMNIYRDGALWAQNTGQTSSIISLDGGQASIGRYSNGSTNAYYHNGIVPVMRIYNVELTALQVAQNFQSYRSRFGI